MATVDYSAACRLLRYCGLLEGLSTISRVVNYSEAGSMAGQVRVPAGRLELSGNAGALWAQSLLRGVWAASGGGARHRAVVQSCGG